MTDLQARSARVRNPGRDTAEWIVLYAGFVVFLGVILVGIAWFLIALWFQDYETDYSGAFSIAESIAFPWLDWDPWHERRPFTFALRIFCWLFPPLFALLRHRKAGTFPFPTVIRCYLVLSISLYTIYRFSGWTTWYDTL